MEKERINSGSIIDVQTLKRIAQFVRPYKGRLALVTILTLLLGIMAPLRPMLIQYTLDTHVAYGNYNGLVSIILLVLLLLLVYSGLQYIHTYIAGYLGQHIVRDVRIKLYSHLVNFRLSFFNKTPVGRLVTRSVSDVEALSDMFTEGLAALIADLLQIIFILFFMFITDWRLTLISLSTIPLMLISTYIFKEKIKVSFNEVRNAISNLNSFVQERLTGMNVLQIFGSEKRELKKFKAINKEHRSAHLKSVLYYSIYFPVAEIISATGIALLIWYGTQNIIGHTTGITVGVLTAFIMYLQMFSRPIRMMADRYNTLQMGVVSSARIVSILDEYGHLTKDGHQQLMNIRGKVSFRNVWFAYQDADYVLRGITFDARPNETVALVGATGAGKSSIVSLINRLYDIKRGTITIDDINIQSASLASLRRNVGIALQDVFLFSDTIRYNITLGDESIDEQTLHRAIKAAGASHFIARMPGGLDYQLNERGNTLSAGQRQIIAFIRSIVYDPKILILDEATSTVDYQMEKMIQTSMKKIMKNRTAIVIAHRLSTIQQADNIIVMDHGEIKEMGNHEVLLTKGGYYAQLHKMQYKSVI